MSENSSVADMCEQAQWERHIRCVGTCMEGPSLPCGRTVQFFRLTVVGRHLEIRTYDVFADCCCVSSHALSLQVSILVLLRTGHTSSGTAWDHFPGACSGLRTCLSDAGEVMQVPCLSFDDVSADSFLIPRSSARFDLTSSLCLGRSINQSSLVCSKPCITWERDCSL